VRQGTVIEPSNEQPVRLWRLELVFLWCKKKLRPLARPFLASGVSGDEGNEGECVALNRVSDLLLQRSPGPRMSLSRQTLTPTLSRAF